MELTYDWRAFQSMFYPHRRASATRGAAPNSPVYLVVDGDVIVSAFSEQEDLTDWVGASYREMKATSPHRELMAFDRAQVDGWMNESTALPHYYDQVQHLRSRAAGTLESKKLALPRHFLVDAVYGWWSKVLPSCYGVFIRIESQPEQDILLLVRRGVFEGFHRPDLASLSADRRKQPGEIVKYLSEKYLVPVQGVFASPSDWAAWSRERQPWRKVAKAVSSQRARLVPFRWGVASLLTVRAFFRI